MKNEQAQFKRDHQTNDNIDSFGKVKYYIWTLMKLKTVFDTITKLV